MQRRLLVTGATGALGLALVSELVRTDVASNIDLVIRPGREHVGDRFDRICRYVQGLGLSVNRLALTSGDICKPWEFGVPDETEVIVHAAADTRFRGDPAELERANISATRHMLDWARRCRGLSHVVLVSTACVAGVRVGAIAEDAPRPTAFINPYEATKWQAETVAIASGLPMRVVRLSTCTGNQPDGATRAGAFHLMLHWLYRGLVPMVPGNADTPVDMIPTEAAAAFLARAASVPAEGTTFFHVAAGMKAPALGEVLAYLADLFGETHAGWRRRQIAQPMMVDQPTFLAFRTSVERTRDLLFCQLLEAMDAFLPALHYPKRYETSRAERFWGGPLPVPDWRELLRRAVHYCLQTNWGRAPLGGVRHGQ